MRSYLSVAVVLSLGLGAGQAAAQSEGAEKQQMTLPRGNALINVFLELNLSEDLAFEPISIAPDVWYGVTDDFTLGLVTSGRAAIGMYGSVGDGLCLTGSNNGCPKVFDRLGLDARYHVFRTGGFTLAVDGGLFASHLDPFTLSLKLGLLGRLQCGALALELAPSLFIGLSERDAGNKGGFFLPATVLYQVVGKLGLAAQLGLSLPFESTGDTFLLSASIGAELRSTDRLSIDLVFSLPALAGGDAIDTGFEARALTLGVGYAL